MQWPRLMSATGAGPAYRSRSAPVRLLFIGYGCFLTGFFVFPEAHQRHWFYLCFVLLPFLATAPARVRPMCLQRRAVPATLFIVYMAATGLWSDGGSWRCVGENAVLGLLTASFLSVSMRLMHEYGDEFHLLLKMVCAGAAVFGLVSILVWYAGHPFPASRLISFGKLNNPVLVGLAYGPFALLAASHFLASEPGCRRTLFLAVFIVLFTVILLTQSRTVAVATVAGLGVSIWCWRRSALVVVAVLGLAFLADMLGGGVTARFGQGFGYRMEIWRSAVESISAAPLIGHGCCSDNTVTAAGHTFVHAHSGYLTAARDGGMIGLALLLFLLVQAASQALGKLRRRGDPTTLALLVYTILCLFPDTDRLLTPPKEGWLYFWLPIALASARMDSEPQRAG